MLSFSRWLNSDPAPAMENTVEVYNGGAWVVIWKSAGAVADAAWKRVSFDATPFKNSMFRIRFGYSITQAGGPPVGSWNIDDVTIASTACK